MKAQLSDRVNVRVENEKLLFRKKCPFIITQDKKDKIISFHL